MVDDLGPATVATDEVELATRLAGRYGATTRPSLKTGALLCFESDERFVAVVPPHQAHRADLALAYSMRWAAGRSLLLFIPKGFEFPTVQRTAWLKRTVRPKVYTVDSSGDASPVKVPTQNQSLERYDEILERTKTSSFDQELERAAKPKHLGKRSDFVAELVEWATKHDVLDAAHRRNERSWHCAGQRVLSITTPGRDAVCITAGIHETDCWSKTVGRQLAPSEVAEITARVDEGIRSRLKGPFRKPDEHWLQSMIRREPTAVGIEPPALREVPAWRPTAPKKKGGGNWRRGFIDLLGVDAHGDMRLVETKLAKASDPLLILQGLDYYMWSLVYRDAIRRRLGASKRAQTWVHYVVGATPSGDANPSPYVEAQATALDIPWKFQTVRGWFKAPARVPSLDVELYDELPTG